MDLLGLPAGTRRRSFGVEEYFRMGEVGIIHEDDRVELIDGQIVEMAAVGGPHLACVNRLNELFVGFSGGRYIVSVQNPVVLDDDKAPEPDVALLERRADFYAGSVPRAADVLLLVEVAATSLEWDRDVKLPRYGRAGIPEVWIVDLRTELVTSWSEPGVNGEYAVRREYGRGERARSESLLPDLALDVDRVLGEVPEGRRS